MFRTGIFFDGGTLGNVFYLISWYCFYFVSTMVFMFLVKCRLKEWVLTLPINKSFTNCVVVFCADDNNTSHNEVLCPPDSRPDPLSPLGRCVCAPELCAPPAPCPEPSSLRTRAPSGVPGDCCDSTECVPPSEY